MVFLAFWLIVYISLQDKESKKEMLHVSLLTSLLGLTEPVFVPEYWNPPTLFDLASKTGFDIESLLFSFAVGGLAVVLYEWISSAKHVAVSTMEKHHPRHKFHLFALFSTPVIFLILFFFTQLNPIYSTILALVGGGLATLYCRPDLLKKMFVSSLLFLILYFLFFESLVIVYPNFVENYWNLKAISGILIFGIPLEELLFALGLGFLWSSIFEHLKWRKLKIS